MEAKSETPADYRIRNEKRDSATIRRALKILESRMVKGKSFTSPDDVKSYLIMHNGAQHDQHRERFGVIYLDSQHAMIEYRIEFIGTLSQTSVYPREIVRHALAVNAASVILTHNHPSGSLDPSRADEELTKTLKSALSLVDIRVLDHFITSGGRAQSMAELGLV